VTKEEIEKNLTTVLEENSQLFIIFLKH